MASGSSDYLLDPAPSFEKSVLDLEAATYRRKDKKGLEEFRARLAQELDKLFDYPKIAGCRREPSPTGIGDQITKLGWLFHKVEFTVPRANGAARQGRLMFLAHLHDRLIMPLYVYTHAQFPGRVPDRSLEAIINSAVRTSQEMKVIKVPEAMALTPVAGEPASRAAEPLPSLATKPSESAEESEE